MALRSALMRARAQMQLARHTTRPPSSSLVRCLSEKRFEIKPTSDRETGTVKWFSASKGYGFIQRERGEELFVHYQSIRGQGYRALEEGQRVAYIVADSQKGPVAEDVTLSPKG
mmetsp:Transcript_9972/g.18154  ORF Transcript_9972/g.18154 Transcript_9972/m.18154 type:complete len:114 (+) Transcript_9972:19-360(+)